MEKKLLLWADFLRTDSSLLLSVVASYKFSEVQIETIETLISYWSSGDLKESESIICFEM